MAKNNPKPNVDPRNVALFIIDVQRALFSRPTPIHNAKQLIGNLNSLIDMWAQEGGLVVYIQHSNKKMLLKGTLDWELHPDLRIINQCEWIHKLHGNAFEKTELNDLLASRDIKEVVITGLVTQGCVRATCIGAKSLDYQVLLVEDGHSNYSKGAEKIIEEWNHKLAENGVQLVVTDNIISQKNRPA